MDTPALDYRHFNGDDNFFSSKALLSVLQCTSVLVSRVTIILVMQLVFLHECTYEGAKGWTGAQCQCG